MKYSQNGLQYHLQIQEGDIGQYVILPGDPGRCAQIAELFDEASFVAQNREYVTYTGTLDGVRVSTVSTGIGGPSAAIALEELVRAGADTFLRVGTCGGIDPAVESGDLVIASAAVRQEGTSREYAPIEFPAAADHHLVCALEQAAAGLGYPVHVGIVQSKDSFYGQHEPEVMPVSYELEQKWEAWKRLGVLASEMETAALYVTASHLHVRTAAVLLTVANQEREKTGLNNPVVTDTAAAVKTAVEAIRSLIRKS